MGQIQLSRPERKPAQKDTPENRIKKYVNKSLTRTFRANNDDVGICKIWRNDGKSPVWITEWNQITLILHSLHSAWSAFQHDRKERISSFVAGFCELAFTRPIAQKQESYIEDTAHKSDIIENTPLADEAI